MRRSIVGAVAAATLLLCALAVAFRHQPLVRRYDVAPVTFRPPPSPTTATRTLPPAPTVYDSSGYNYSLAVMFYLGTAIALVAIVVLLIVATVRALQVRRVRRRRAAEPLPDPVVAVRESVDRALQQLDVGTPDNAIIACWVALQDAVREAGVEPRDSETPSELVLRVLSDLPVERTALMGLASLYREARFSHHPLAEIDRANARGHLSAIRRDLSGSEAEHVS